MGVLPLKRGVIAAIEVPYSQPSGRWEWQVIGLITTNSPYSTSGILEDVSWTSDNHTPPDGPLL